MMPIHGTSLQACLKASAVHQHYIVPVRELFHKPKSKRGNEIGDVLYLFLLRKE
jgi:hypothetical protein